MVEKKQTLDKLWEIMKDQPDQIVEKVRSKDMNFESIKAIDGTSFLVKCDKKDLEKTMEKIFERVIYDDR